MANFSSNGRPRAMPFLHTTHKKHECTCEHNNVCAHLMPPLDLHKSKLVNNASPIGYVRITYDSNMIAQTGLEVV